MIVLDYAPNNIWIFVVEIVDHHIPKTNDGRPIDLRKVKRRIATCSQLGSFLADLLHRNIKQVPHILIGIPDVLVNFEALYF